MRGGGCVPNEWNYSHIPREIWEYAIDQANDRMLDEEWKELEGITFEDCLPPINCKNVHFWNEGGKDLFERILEEKREDIGWEVRHGERDDWTIDGLLNISVEGVFNSMR